MHEAILTRRTTTFVLFFVFCFLLFLFGFFNNFNFVLNKNLTVRQDLSIATRMQIIGMNNAGLSGRAIGPQLRWNHIVISHLVKQ